MLIARFMDAAGGVRRGRLLDDQSALPLRGDLFGALEFDPQPIQVARLLAPLDPPNIFAIGLNYRGHAAEQGLTRLPEHPLIFSKPTTSVIGPGDTIELPAAAPNEVDYEAELAVIIGRRCRRVSESDALDSVLGYTCANDVSARDCQKRIDKQWTRAKGFDTFCPLGPAIRLESRWAAGAVREAGLSAFRSKATGIAAAVAGTAAPVEAADDADRFDPSAARIRAVLNGAVMQDASTSDLIFGVPFLVSYLSHQFTLLPGTVILTGTPDGVGFTRNPPVFLRTGDRIEVRIEGVGVIINNVIAAS